MSRRWPEQRGRSLPGRDMALVWSHMGTVLGGHDGFLSRRVAGNGNDQGSFGLSSFEASPVPGNHPAGLLLTFTRSVWLQNTLLAEEKC